MKNFYHICACLRCWCLSDKFDRDLYLHLLALSNRIKVDMTRFVGEWVKIDLVNQCRDVFAKTRERNERCLTSFFKNLFKLAFRKSDSGRGSVGAIHHRRDSPLTPKSPGALPSLCSL